MRPDPLIQAFGGSGSIVESVIKVIEGDRKAEKKVNREYWKTLKAKNKMIKP
jgi:hypothetical protein